MADHTIASAFFKPVDNLRTLLADTSSFRTYVSASTQAQALARIYKFGKETTSLTYPYAVIGLAQGASYATIGTSGNGGFGPSISGSLVIHFFDDVNATYDGDLQNLLAYFFDTTGYIMQEMCSLSTPGSTYLQIRSASFESGEYVDEVEGQETPYLHSQWNITLGYRSL